MVQSIPDQGQAQQWSVNALLFGAQQTQYAVIMLNQPVVEPHKQLVSDVWKNATLRLCADGGANRLYDAFGEEGTLPHEIRGDLDSIRPQVRTFYEQHGVRIVRAASEYATDLQKCIIAVEEYEAQHGIPYQQRLNVVLLGGLSGRLDQTMHTLHVLCHLAPPTAFSSASLSPASEGKRRKDMNQEATDFVQLDRRSKTVVLSENSLAWLMTEGTHTVQLDQTRVGPTCGLLPFAAQIGEGMGAGTRIWTEGLRWDLDGEISAIGGFLSTSNHLKEDTVTVKVDQAIIWTVEVR